MWSHPGSLCKSPVKATDWEVRTLSSRNQILRENPSLKYLSFDECRDGQLFLSIDIESMYLTNNHFRENGCGLETIMPITILVGRQEAVS